METKELKAISEDRSPFANQMAGQIGIFCFCIALSVYLFCLGLNISDPPANWKPIAKNNLMNVNTATWSELLQIPGITEATAWNIVRHRELNGEYSSVDQLSKIKGVGKKSFEKIKLYVVSNSGNTLPMANVAEVQRTIKGRPDQKNYVKLDPNAATMTELQSLPGIGLKLAGNIIKARENSVFVRAEDLLLVPGIGKKTFEKIAPFIEIRNEKK